MTRFTKRLKVGPVVELGRVKPRLHDVMHLEVKGHLGAASTPVLLLSEYLLSQPMWATPPYLTVPSAISVVPTLLFELLAMLKAAAFSASELATAWDCAGT